MVKEVVMQRERNNVIRADYLQHLLNVKNKAVHSSDTDNGHDFALQKNSICCILYLLNHLRLVDKIQTEMANNSRNFSLSDMSCSI